MSRRAIILVLDSFGIGATADAAQFGDAGADTLGHIAEACAAGLAGRSCGYVYNTCQQQRFCGCKLLSQTCDVDTGVCSTICVSGTGGTITTELLAPPICTSF